MRVARLFATVAIATVGGLAFATPALADGTPVQIHSSHVPTTAADFGKKECTGPFADLADNKDGWHFVTTGQASFTSVTLKFDTPGDDAFTLTITGTEAAKSTGSGWTGWLDNAGSAEKHAYLIADAGWKLLEGSAVVTNVDEQSEFFNLSHTCAGTPDTSESPSPSPSRSTPGDPSPDPSVSTSPSSGGNLPRTGTATGAIVIGGIALVAGGVALLAIRRRRDMVGS